MQPNIKKTSFLLGICGWLTTAFVAIFWQLATKVGVSTTLKPLDLAMIRYALPAMILFPIILIHWKNLLEILSELRERKLFALMFLGIGLPFGLTFMWGAQFAPVSHIGVFIAGGVPFFVGIFSVFLAGRVGHQDLLSIKNFGLALLLMGMIITIFSTIGLNFGSIFGDLIFLFAAALWAIYALAFSKSRFDVWLATATVCLASTAVLIPLWFLTEKSSFSAAPLTDVLFQVFAQGICAGTLGIVGFGLAVKHLGPTLASSSAVAIPVGTALGGYWLFGEAVNLTYMFGAAMAICGILLVTGLVGTRQKKINPP